MRRRGFFFFFFASLSFMLAARVRTQLGLMISANWGAHYDHPGLFKIEEAKIGFHGRDPDGDSRAGGTYDAGEVTADELETARQSALNGLVFAFDTRRRPWDAC